MRSIITAILLFLIIQSSLLAQKTPPIAKRSQNKIIFIAMSEMRTPSISGEWNSWNYPRSNNVNKPSIFAYEAKRTMDLPFYPAIGLYDMADADYQEYTCQLMKMCYVDAISHHIKGSKNDEHRKKGLAQFAKTCKKYGIASMVRSGDRGTQLSSEWISEQIEFIHHQAIAPLMTNGKITTSYFSVNDKNVNDLLELKEMYKAKYKQDLYIIMRIKNLTEEQAKWTKAVDAGYDWVGFNARRVSTLNYLGYDWYVTPEQIRANYTSDVQRGMACVKGGYIDMYIEGVSPGFDDKSVNGWGDGSHCVPRNNGITYEWRWKEAVKNNFPMIVIPTWNDYPEGSVIQPSVEFGNKYMEMTRYYGAQYKGIQPNTANLMLPEWIYKIRKMSRDKKILSDMEKASHYINKEKYDKAEQLLQTYVSLFPMIHDVYFDPEKAIEN